MSVQSRATPAPGHEQPFTDDSFRAGICGADLRGYHRNNLCHQN